MNKSAFLFAIVLLFAGPFVACKKDVSSPTTLPATASNIAGNFTVNSFTTTSDQTSLFTDYQFAFSDNGTVTATKDGVASNGTWMFDDSNNTELKLSFPTSPLNELNKGWHIADLTTEHMLLTDDDDSHENGDDNTTSHNRLEFERD